MEDSRSDRDCSPFSIVEGMGLCGDLLLSDGSGCRVRRYRPAMVACCGAFGHKAGCSSVVEFTAIRQELTGQAAIASVAGKIAV